MITTLAKKLLISIRTPLVLKSILFRRVLFHSLSQSILPDVNKVGIKNMLIGKLPVSDYNSAIGLGFRKAGMGVGLRHPQVPFLIPGTSAAEVNWN